MSARGENEVTMVPDVLSDTTTDLELVLTHWQDMERWGTLTDSIHKNLRKGKIYSNFRHRDLQAIQSRKSWLYAAAIAQYRTASFNPQNPPLIPATTTASDRDEPAKETVDL
jgi:hypothetical protein